MILIKTRKFIALAFSFVFLTIMPKRTMAFSDEQKIKVMLHFSSSANECALVYPLTDQDMITMSHNMTFPTSGRAACFSYCLCKKIGIMDDSGVFSKDGILNITYAVFEDQKDIDNAKKLMSKCTEVSMNLRDRKEDCKRVEDAIMCKFRHSVQGLTEEQRAIVLDRFSYIGDECSNEFPLSYEDVVAFRKAQAFPSGGNLACFATCMAKRSGLMDEYGRFSTAGVLAAARAIFQNTYDFYNALRVIGICTPEKDLWREGSEDDCLRASKALTCIFGNYREHSIDLH